MLALLTLFLAAFLAATIVPFSSEVALIAALSLELHPLYVISAASLGNILAITFNYYIGLFIRRKSYKKLKKTHSGKLTIRWFKRYGNFTLLLTVLPVIGDPLTIISGIYKLNFILFFTVTASLRILRYVIISYIYLEGTL